MGNGPAESGDGWRYRGRGLIQLTGRSGYAKAGLGIGVPLVEHPELAVDKANAALIAGWYWRMKNLDAVIGDVRSDTIAVNGGTTGLAEREALYKKAKEALHV
jgi:putative chitinase